MATNDVKILVKNVYAPGESQQFVVVDSLQVRALKEMIATALPGNPQPKQQKLIFGGKICNDDDTLAKVLAGQNKDARDGDAAAGGDNAAPFVFHLMVSSGVLRNRPTTPVARPQTQTQQQQQPAPTQSSAASPAPAQEPAATVDARGPAAQQTPTHPAAQPAFPFAGFFGAAPASAANAAGAPAAAAPHFGNHHHLFTQAILMQQQAMILSQIQYLQQLQAHHASATHAATTATPPPAQAAAPFAPFGPFGHHFGHHGYAMPPPHAPAFGHNVHNNGHAGVYPGAFPAAHVPGVQAAGVEAPAAAGVAVAEPRARGPIAQAFAEILPLFDIRLALKMAFMLFIIGQDTPTDRLIVLALMSFGAYLHITGILGKVYELLKCSRGAPEANAGAEGEEGGANNANPNGAPNAQARLGAITRYLRISADRGLVHDIRYFFTGLLLSLVPAWHPQPLHGDPAAPQPHAEPAMAEAAPELPLQGI